MGCGAALHGLRPPQRPRERMGCGHRMGRCRCRTFGCRQQICASSAEFGQMLATSDPISANLGHIFGQAWLEIRPKFGKVWPSLTPQLQQQLAKFGPSLAEVLPKSTDIGQHLAESRQTRPNFGQVRPKLPDSHGIGSTSAKVDLGSVKFDQDGRISRGDVSGGVWAARAQHVSSTGSEFEPKRKVTRSMVWGGGGQFRGRSPEGRPGGPLRRNRPRRPRGGVFGVLSKAAALCEDASAGCSDPALPCLVQIPACGG